MSETNQEGQTVEPGNGTGQGVNVDQNQTLSEEVDKIKAELESKFEEKFKSEIAGLNRKNSELQASLKKKELDGKTEAEQLSLIKEEKQRVEKEIEQLNRARLIDKSLSDMGLPLEFAKRITGNTEDEIKEDIKMFSEYLEKVTKDMADKTINEKLSGKAPEGGTSPDEKQKIKRSDFDSLDPAQQMEKIRAGVKITD